MEIHSTISKQKKIYSTMKSGKKIVYIADYVVENLGNLAFDENELQAVVEVMQSDKLSFDGAKYVNLEYKPTSNTKIDIDFFQTTAAKFLFGCRTSGSSSDAFAFIAYATSMYPQFGSFQAVVSPTDMSLNEKHRLVLSQDGAYIDDTAVKTFDTMNFTSTLDLYIGTRNQSGTLDSRMFVGDIYSIAIYENDELVRYYLPAIKNNDYGFLDIINGDFYAQISNESLNMSMSMKLNRMSLKKDINDSMPVGDTMTPEEAAHELR